MARDRPHPPNQPGIGGAGTVLVEADQQPVNPLTYQIGAGVSIRRRWEVLVEVGSNIDDAFVGVLSTAFRF